MIKHLVYIGVLVQFFCFSVSNAEPDYYWREYTGVIPNDAIPAGQNVNGNNIYIGQGYLHGYGLITGQITTGINQISVAYHGRKVIDRYMKILCGQKEKFGWVRTSKESFHQDLDGKILVVSGHDSDPDGLGGDLNVGRIVYKGETHVGKINAWDNSGADFLIKVIDDYNNEVISVSVYEILVYNG